MQLMQNPRIKALNQASLRLFGMGQLFASAAGIVFVLILPLILPGVPIPIVTLLVITGITLFGAVLTLYLIARNLLQPAVYAFVIAQLVVGDLAIITIGARSGVAAIYIWVISVASMVLGGLAAGVVIIACIVLATISFALETFHVYTPPIGGEASVYLGHFAVILAFGLAGVVAIVAGGNIRRALAETEEKATQLEAAYSSLSQATTVGATVTSEARNLAAALVNSSSQQEASASTAASSIAQISAQISELSATATQILASARSVRDVGDRTHEMAEDTRARLDKDRDQLNQAVQAGEQLQTAARQVSENVKQMGQIIGLITEVAEETHMLSLNATIEATGTGETGRRFKVIAQEVGNLAAKVNSSTEQVGAIVQNVQRTVQAMIGIANQAVDSIKRSQIANLATGEQINQVSQAASEVAREGFLIVSSTEQQRKATSEIDNAVGGVAGVSRQAEEASKQLATIASQLNLTVDRLAALLPEQEVTEATDGESTGTSSDDQSLRVTTNLSKGLDTAPSGV